MFERRSILAVLELHLCVLISVSLGFVQRELFCLVYSLICACVVGVACLFVGLLSIVVDRVVRWGASSCVSISQHAFLCLWLLTECESLHAHRFLFVIAVHCTCVTHATLAVDAG